MKVLILAGGLGTRLSEETEIRPKPMVEIGGKPVKMELLYIKSLFFSVFFQKENQTAYKKEYYPLFHPKKQKYV